MKRTRQERPESPELSCVSFRSDHSKKPPLAFKDGHCSPEKKTHQEHPESPELSCVSFRSDHSKKPPLAFKDGRCSPEKKTHQEHPESPELSCVSFRSDHSKKPHLAFKDGHCSPEKKVDQKKFEAPSDPSAKHHQTDLDSVFMLLEENIITFVKNELKKFKRVLNQDNPECLEEKSKVEDMINTEEEEQTRRSREAFLKITLDFLRRMKLDELAESLQSKSPAACQLKLKSNLKERFQCLFEGITKAGNPALLNEIYTELYITERGTGEIFNRHEVRQIETALRKSARSETTVKFDKIFKPGSTIRTVMTKGVAGIGKTFLTHKFVLDWAEDKTHHNIQFAFPVTFRELNLLKTKKYSLVELIHHLFNETKEAGIFRFEELQVVFIFDGLDECRLPLDFHNTEILTDVTESSSVEVLLTNLIRGKLLPSAYLWITSRPAAANQVPPENIDMVTEVRGFTDLQKEEYFRKRFRDEEQASRIISHIKTTQSLHTMCQIPIFCWITATVLGDVMKPSRTEELPKTLTEMYIHFLVVQTKLSNTKFHGGAETDPHWNPQSRQMILSLGKLAFEQLQQGNLIFYESDLTECGLGIRAATEYSGMFTQIFKEERGLYQDKVFCFVHLSVQEFLAALYLDLMFINSGLNLLAEEELTSQTSEQLSNKSKLFYQSAVDKALQSPNGQLDLFLRFLLGLSVETNQNLLRGLLMQKGSNSQTSQDTAEYVKEKVRENISPERIINLFHCLNELKDHSLVEEIQHYLSLGRFSTEKPTPAQWSALVFILLSSEDELDMFDLKKYSASDEALLRLLPVVKASKKAVLSNCNLSKSSCEVLATVLCSESCCLTELDLRNNDLEDSGVKQLSVGLENPNCRLEILRLSGCLITDEGCVSLVTALSLNPSHLKELDLSYNNLGDSGIKRLSAGLKDPQWRLDTLRVDHGGEQWLKPGLKKYGYELTLNPNTANRNVFLSESNRKATIVRGELPYPDHPDRFDFVFGVLCVNALTGRCYWEVEREGWLSIAVTYQGIGRKGDDNECRFGRNDKSWALFASDDLCSAWHNDSNKTILIPTPSFQKKVAVYLDTDAGTLSFYSIMPDTLIHLHTFHSTFTEPLYPAFGFRYGSAVSLCQLSDVELTSGNTAQLSKDT